MVVSTKKSFRGRLALASTSVAPGLTIHLYGICPRGRRANMVAIEVTLSIHRHSCVCMKIGRKTSPTELRQHAVCLLALKSLCLSTVTVVFAWKLQKKKLHRVLKKTQPSETASQGMPQVPRAPWHQCWSCESSKCQQKWLYFFEGLGGAGEKLGTIV